MAFTIYGPGLKDPVILDNLFEKKHVDEVHPSTAIKPVNEKDGLAGDDFLRRQKKEQAKQIYQSAQQKTNRERQPAVIAEQCMSSPVITLSPQTSILDAWQLFRERRFRHVPVITEENTLFGIISDRTLLRYAATNGRVPPYAVDSVESKMSIEPLVTRQVLTATPDTEIRQIARVLFEKRIGAMPIVTNSGVLVGIITRSDILRVVITHAPLELWV